MNNVKGLISVIIPCFQQGKYIEQAIESVLSQTYKDWECIIVNDGSTDNSENILRGFVERDNRIRYINQKNVGVAAARNKGFSEASGEYLQLLDGDDYLDSEKFKVQMDFMNTHPEIEITYTDVQYYYEDKELLEKYPFRRISDDPLHDFLFGWRRGVSVPIHTALFKRSIWENGEMPFCVDYHGRCEDWIFWINIALKNTKFSFIDRDLAFYRMHSTSFGSSEEYLLQFIKAAFFIKKRVPSEMREKFIDSAMEYCFDEFSKQKIQREVYSSMTWKVAKIITSPILYILPAKLKQAIKKKMSMYKTQ